MRQGDKRVQKSNFDWDYFRGEMCEKVPANHMPSYFPAEGVLEAQDLAILLGKASFLAGQPGPLSYDLSCKTYRGEQCAPGNRQFLSELRFDEIGETSRINCGYAEGPAHHCFTVKIGEHRLGPWPKRITIKGSTYKNNWKVFEVSIRESFTIS